MDRKVLISLGDAGIEVGTLWMSAQAGRVYSAFAYTPSWLAHDRRFALSPDLPLTAERKFFHPAASDPHASALPSPLADSVPDAWGRMLLRKSREGSGSTALSEFDYFLSVDDFGRVGALRVQDLVTGKYFASGEKGKSAIPPIVQLKNLVRDVHSIERGHPDMEALQRILGGGSSLGGARPKCTVIKEDGSLAIAKFTSRFDTQPVEKAEVLTLRLARLCGLETPNVKLLQSNGFPLALIDRFDRARNGRIPYLSAQSFLGLQSAVGGTYVDFADRLREAAVEPERQMRELFGRVSYTILVSNTDDHLKNHALLYDFAGRGWRLSPLYDVNPSPERQKELKTAIADPSDRRASLRLLLEYAGFFGVTKDQGADLIKRQAVIIADRWRPLAQECGMSRQEIDIYRDAFEHEEARFALREVRQFPAVKKKKGKDVGID